MASCYSSRLAKRTPRAKGAAQAGEVIEGGAMKAAHAVESVSGDAARRL